MEIVSLLQKLTGAPGVSGAEHEAAAVAAEELRSLCSSVYTDKRGTVVGHFSGEGEEILLDAHIDSIGFIITSIEERGFLKFEKCGAVDERVLSGLEVTIHGREDVFGVISSVPPHLATPADEGRAKPCSELAIDTGLTSEDCERLISLGDRATVRFKFDKLLNDEVTSASLDDRAGVAVHLRALEILNEAKQKGAKVPNVTVTFSVSEEEGGRGAATAAFTTEAKTAIEVDVSFAKTPGCEREECGIIGEGPMIGISPILDNSISNDLISLAKELDMPYQREIMSGRTGTHADELAVCKNGIKTGLVSIPLKYMHTPCEVVNVNDIENCARIIAEFCLRRAEVAFHD